MEYKCACGSHYFMYLPSSEQQERERGIDEHSKTRLLKNDPLRICYVCHRFELTTDDAIDEYSVTITDEEFVEYKRMQKYFNKISCEERQEYKRMLASEDTKD